MKIKQPLIFTDLDGTLLDHHTYSFEPALPLINELNNKSVPIIANTSKTKAELLKIQKKIGLHSPFISENGAAVYLPKKLFPSQPDKSTDKSEFWCMEFSRPRSHWVSLLNELAPELQSLFQTFSQMSPEQLAEETGLTKENVELATQREFGEPLKWLGSDEQKAIFIEELEKSGATVLQGGRFLHVGDRVNKGLAMIWLKKLYRKKDYEPLAIALGDSGNDIDMLKEADIAVIIKSPVHPYPSVKRKGTTIYTEATGPDGWVEGLSQVLYR